MQAKPVSLLERLREPGADQAWGRFVDLYTPLLFAWARQLGLGESEAGQLVQDVLTSLMTKVRDFGAEPSANFRNWLLSVVMNQWFDQCRRRGAVTPTNDEPVVGTIDISCTSEEYGKQLMPRAFEVLRPEFDAATWQACWEHVVCGKAAQQVGAELGLSEAAVYTARYRVLQRLRQELEGLLG